MILYLKQSIDPGDILFYITDQLGHLCYEIKMQKHRFGKRLSIINTEQKEMACINCIGFAKMLRCGILVKEAERLSLLCSFSSSEPLFKISGQTWVFRGEVLRYSFDVVDVDRTVIFTHGRQWLPSTGNVYGVTVFQEKYVLESLCISTVIDTFSPGTENPVVITEMN